MSIQTYTDYTSQITKSVYFYSTTIVVPMGLILNFIQFLIFLRKDFEKGSFGFLMNSFIVTDSLALIFSFVIYLYLPQIGYNISIYSQIYCALFIYVIRVFQEIPLYFQAYISFCNYLNVSNFTRFVRLDKKLYHILCFTLITVLITVFNFPNAFRVLQIKNSSKTCYKSPLVDVTITLEYSILRSILPFILINTLNLLTFKTILNSRIRLNRSIEKEIRFAKILIISGLFFILFNLPAAIADITLNVYRYAYLYSSNTYFMLTLNLINNLTRSFSYIYYGIGFFINLFFNNKFRKILLICFNEYSVRSTTQQQQQQQQTAQRTRTGQQTAT
jgi:hypothetical protein